MAFTRGYQPGRGQSDHMKCPQCGAHTDVKSTKHEVGVVIRRRICFNDHSFNTEEKAVSKPKPKRKQIDNNR
jgi:transcriptional regulator NrdR family protein